MSKVLILKAKEGETARRGRQVPPAAFQVCFPSPIKSGEEAKFDKSDLPDNPVPSPTNPIIHKAIEAFARALGKDYGKLSGEKRKRCAKHRKLFAKRHSKDL